MTLRKLWRIASLAGAAVTVVGMCHALRSPAWCMAAMVFVVPTLFRHLEAA
jgi:hypothetical protein